MSKIPYHFNTPIPRYFWDIGYLNLLDEKNFTKRIKFLLWAFSRCSWEARKVFYDNREIILEPFEFICGRLKASQEIGLSEKEIRGQLKCLSKFKIIKKGANSRANRYTCYIWLTWHFDKIEGQQKGQPRANSGPTEGHNLELRTKNKERTTPLPPNQEIGGVVSFFNCLDEIPLTNEEKQRFMNLKYSEERANLAVKYVIEQGSKIQTPIGSLIWHCKQPTPPISSSISKQTEQQCFALKYNEFLSQNGHGETAETNEDLILAHHYMKYFMNGTFTTISLKIPLNELKKDIELSKQELQYARK